ncbi:MAG: hypothetical protein LKF41_01135 [Bifidobacterium sp.]|jgi:hypothetical protein|nr:hypothetical protein [Bifidobacterium sp.]MCH4174446.1 hypothetical protein [Bifidobacterium sp.]
MQIVYHRVKKLVLMFMVIAVVIIFSSTACLTASAQEVQQADIPVRESLAHNLEIDSFRSANEPSHDIDAITSAVAAYDQEDPSTVLKLAQTVAGQSAQYESASRNEITVEDGMSLCVDPTSGAVQVNAESDTSEDDTVTFTSKDSVDSSIVLNGAIIQSSNDEEASNSVTQPTDDGFQIIAIINDENASTDVDFDIDLPDATTLQLQDDGSISVITELEVQAPDSKDQIRYESEVEEMLDVSLQEGMEISESEYSQIQGVEEVATIEQALPVEVAVIESPWAVDATGKQLDTHFEITDDGVRQVIETDDSTVFPVIADPSWLDKAKKWLGSAWTWTRGKVWSGAICTTKWVKSGSKWVWKSGKFAAKKAGYLGLALCAAGGVWAWYRSDASGWVRVGDAVSGCLL